MSIVSTHSAAKEQSAEWTMTWAQVYVRGGHMVLVAIGLMVGAKSVGNLKKMQIDKCTLYPCSTL